MDDLDQATGLLEGMTALYWAVMDSPQATDLDREMAAGGLAHAEVLVSAAVSAEPGQAASGAEHEAEAG